MSSPQVAAPKPCSTIFLGLVLFCGSAFAADLRIEVLRGAGSNNNAVTGGAVSPTVRVSDASGKPVRGALVIFTAPATGSSLDFGGAGRIASEQTDETGTAVAPRIRPVGGNGPVEISVVAEEGANLGSVFIYQMNLGVKAGPEPDELDVIKTSDSGEPQGKEYRQVGLRVLNVRGEPMARVGVECAWRVPGAPDKTATFSGPFAATTDAKGEAACEIISLKPIHKPIELRAKATAKGISATRLFSLGGQ